MIKIVLPNISQKFWGAFFITQEISEQFYSSLVFIRTF